MLLTDLVAAGIAYVAAHALLPRICAMLTAGGLVRPNYQEKSTPVAAGIIFPLAALPAIIFWRIINAAHWASGQKTLSLALVLTGMAVAGLLDDAIGNGAQRGIKGHLRAFLAGRLTTGGCKVLLGGFVALLTAATAPWRGYAYPVLAGVIIALSANFINLCDLRPGRAIKVFSLGYLIIALICGYHGGLLLIVPMIALALAPWDLRAKAMMGDTGANALGGALGLFAVEELAIDEQFSMLAVLVAIHVLAERWSISQLIAETPFLRWLDMLGRK